MRKWLIMFLAAAACPAPLLAQSCLDRLAPRRDFDLQATVTTINDRGVVSYATITLVYKPRPPGRLGVILPPAWVTPRGQSAPQLLSDRRAGSQPFASGRADRIALSISHERSPTVNLELLSEEGGARLSGVGTCSPNGIIHINSYETDLMIHVVPVPQLG